jgi:hypothetical protein
MKAFTSGIIIALIMIGLVIPVSAAQLCPWGIPAETVSHLNFNMDLSNTGLVTGNVIAKEDYGRTQYNNVSGYLSYVDGTMAVNGATEYAKMTSISSAPLLQTTKAITFTSGRMTNDEAFLSSFCGNETDQEPFLEMVFDSSGSDITSGQMASTLSLARPSGVLVDYTSAVTGASGSAYASTGMKLIQQNLSAQEYHSSISYSGQFAMAHQFKYSSFIAG